MKQFPLFLLLSLSLILSSCQQSDPPQTTPNPTKTPKIEPTTSVTLPNPDFIVIATDAPYPPFTTIDDFGNINGFDAAIMATIADQTALSYEFVVTSYEGIFANLATSQDFNAVMSGLVIPETAIDGITYSDPYLEVGQLLLVRANETELTQADKLVPTTVVGVKLGSYSLKTAAQLGITEPNLKIYHTIPQAVQGLINGTIQAVILDNHEAKHYAQSYAQQLKIAGGSTSEYWLSHQSYGIAVPATNTILLEKLNGAIASIKTDGTLERLIRSWLIPKESIVAGESLIGTPENEIVIGIAGSITSIDPTTRFPNLIDAEIMQNILSGFYQYDENNQLIPVIADGPPLVSEDKLSYIIRIKTDLTFPNGNPITVDDVAASIKRASGQGHSLINAILQDTNGDGFADAEAIKVIDSTSIKLVLKTPLAYFPSILATNSYYILPEDCSLTATTFTNCSGFGAYTINKWEKDYLQLQANPNWPGVEPKFEHIQIRFYQTSTDLRNALERNAVDIAWTGLATNDLIDLRRNAEFLFWNGSAVFKSYIVFEQSKAPWNDPRIRQAAAYAVDREALASEQFSNLRQPLYSPIPDFVPGHLPTEPQRDLNQAIALLNNAGYNVNNKLTIDLWYLNDGRYTPLEASYAQGIKQQLEETGIFVVTLKGEPWELFRPASSSCDYPAYLLGWPTPGSPPRYLDATSWFEYFITNTDKICSNFDATEAKAILTEAEQSVDILNPLNFEPLYSSYAEIQQIWAESFPTLDLTQEQRILVSTTHINQVKIDGMGLLHYATLTKK